MHGDTRRYTEIHGDTGRYRGDSYGAGGVAVSPLYLPYISPTTPLYLPYISPISRRGRRGRFAPLGDGEVISGDGASRDAGEIECGNSQPVPIAFVRVRVMVS